jgi:hypothetical protein
MLPYDSVGRDFNNPVFGAQSVIQFTPYIRPSDLLSVVEVAWVMCVVFNVVVRTDYSFQ